MIREREVEATGILSIVQNKAVGHIDRDPVVLLPTKRENDGMPALGGCEEWRYAALEEQWMHQQPLPGALRISCHFYVVVQFQRSLRIVHILDSKIRYLGVRKYLRSLFFQTFQAACFGIVFHFGSAIERQMAGELLVDVALDGAVLEQHELRASNSSRSLRGRERRFDE